MSLNFCPECGTKWLQNSRFCSHCGYEHKTLVKNTVTVKPTEKTETLTTAITVEGTPKMNKHQLGILVVLGVVCGLFLFVFTQKTNVQKGGSENVMQKTERLDSLASRFAPITLEDKNKLVQAQNWQDSLTALTLLVNQAEKQQRLEWAGYYRELISNHEKTEVRFLDAASRYYEATKSNQDTALRKSIAIRAIALYEKVLKQNPNNINASVDMAVCYTLTGNPMQGIFMLRDVADKNPNHVLAQHNLGILSMQTGQFEKAAKRFEKVIALKPENPALFEQALLYAGIAYTEAKNTVEAKKKFSTLLATTQNPDYKQEAESYLKRLN